MVGFFVDEAMFVNGPESAFEPVIGRAERAETSHFYEQLLRHKKYTRILRHPVRHCRCAGCIITILLGFLIALSHKQSYPSEIK
jgi:hypothetical protein